MIHFLAFKSVETLHSHQLVHNNIKHMNYLVKFMNGPNDLTKIKIVLTDFGLAGKDTKGGTTIFASPECYETKTVESDIFSLGRVLLFLMLSQTNFMCWLLVPIISENAQQAITNAVNQNELLQLIKKMTKVQKTKRISIAEIRSTFDGLKQNNFDQKHPTLNKLKEAVDQVKINLETAL